MGSVNVESLIDAVDSGRPFDVTAQAQIRPLSFLSRLWHHLDARFHQARSQRIAKAFAQCLANTPRSSPFEADRLKLVLAAKKWLKDNRYLCATSCKVQECIKELLAIRLGISSAVFDRNPGFEQFARGFVLYNYLIRYKHSLKVNEEGELFILHKNQYQRWDAIKQLFDVKVSSTADHPRQPWIYGMEGVQHKDLYDWTFFEPFIKGDPKDWENQYGIEFCTCCIDTPRSTGDHSWIRLYTPEGDIYSHGLYLPGKSNKNEMYKDPLRLKRGQCQSPDVSEFWNVPIQTLFVAIDKDRFEKIKEQIERKKQINEEIFHLFALNCLMDAKRLGEIADVHLPTEASVVYVYAPPLLKRFFRACSRVLPLYVQKICIFVGTIFFNLIQVYFGAAKVDGRVEKFNHKYAPHISFWRDIFNPRKSNLHAPYYFATEVRKQIGSWRSKKLNKSLSAEKAFKVRYGIPKRFRLPVAEV